MARNLVVKHNALIDASYRLSLTEQRLILLSIVESRRSSVGITAMNRLIVSAEIYMKAFNTTRQAAYLALKEACDNLFNREYGYAEIREKGVTIVRSRWVSEIAYNEKEATVGLIFAPSIVPYINNLEQQFTSYELEQVAELNSKYAVRLYEVLIAWRAVGKTPMLTVDELRNRLGVLDGEYQKMEVLKRKVIGIAVKQINEKTDISISYEQHKQGRKIVGFTFSIQPKHPKEAEINLPETRDVCTPDLFDGLTDLERSAIQARIDSHIARLETKGEFVSEFRRQNITKMAAREQWGVDELQAELKQQLQAAKRREIEQRWLNTQNGTCFRHSEDGSIWFKEAGFLRNSENRVVPEGVILDVFQYLKEISDSA